MDLLCPQTHLLYKEALERECFADIFDQANKKNSRSQSEVILWRSCSRLEHKFRVVVTSPGLKSESLMVLRIPYNDTEAKHMKIEVG